MTDPNASYEAPLSLEKLSHVDAATQKMDPVRATSGHQWGKALFRRPSASVKIAYQKMLDGTVKSTVDAAEGVLIEN